MVGCIECFCFIVAIPDLSRLEKTSPVYIFNFFTNCNCRAHHVFHKYTCVGTTTAFIVCVAVVYRDMFFYAEVKIEESRELRAMSCEHEPFFIKTNIAVEKFFEELVARS